METEREKELWKLAKRRVRFRRHLATYIVINTLLWVLWYVTDGNRDDSGIAWPLLVMLGWSIGLIFQFLRAYVYANHRSVEKEYEKLKGK